MREMLVVLNEPHWLEPIVMLCREARVVNWNRAVEYPSGWALVSERTLDVRLANGEREAMRIPKSATVECLLDDGREYRDREKDERALAEWRGEMCV